MSLLADWAFWKVFFMRLALFVKFPLGCWQIAFSYKTNLYLSRIAGIVSSVLMLAGQGNFLDLCTGYGD